MKSQLKHLLDSLEKDQLTELEVKERLLNLIRIPDNILSENNIEIYHHGYGLFQVRLDGEVLWEEPEIDCHLRVTKLLLKRNK